jgi:protein-tyrosine phosphatase
MKTKIAFLFGSILSGLEAAVLNVGSNGVVSGVDRDQSSAISALVAKARQGDEVLFDPGVYYLEHAILVKGKTRLTIRGGAGVVLKLHYSRFGNKSENQGAFEAYDSQKLCIEGFTVTTDHPTSCAGRVIATDPGSHTYDVEIDPAFPISGNEHFASTDTCDEEGTPDWIIETYDYRAGDPHVSIGPQRVRVTAPTGKDLKRLELGHRVLYRHSVYDGSCFRMEGCSDVVVRDIEIERCAGMGLVSKHCTNFTLERFNVRPPSGSPALVSANADAVHVIAMRGRFDMTDCHFERLGDDALNVHGLAGCVMDCDSAVGTFACRYRKNGKTSDLEKDWAHTGDEIAVYDVNTFVEKGRAKLLEYNCGKGRIAPGTIDMKEGDIVANASDSPVVAIRGCSLRHTRARAFVLQASDITVSDCDFYGTSLPGVMISPDARRWAEVGPVRHVEIRNCRFEKCAVLCHDANLGAISVKTSHDGGAGNSPAGVHRDISVIGNVFRNIPCRGIFVASTDGLKVRGNVFEKCGDGTSDPVCAFNCANVDISGNDVVSANGTTSMGLKLVSPAEGEVVPLLTRSQKGFYDLPRAARVDAVTNAVERKRIAGFGSDPNPVCLSWKANSASAFRPQFVVEVIRMRDGLPVVQRRTVEDHLEVSNLEIATEYGWTVRMLEADQIVSTAKGRFVTEDRAPRFIHVSGIVNFRDLGGRRGLGGRRVRQNLVFRSAGLNSNAKLPDKDHPDLKPEVGRNRFTAESRDYFVNTLGIRTDIDLRTDNETWGMKGSPAGEKVRWIHVSANAYGGMQSKGGKEAFAKHFRVFLDRANYPIVFHCIAGADRTGSLAFILNGLLGVDEEELWKDWETHTFIDTNPDFRHRDRMDALSRDFNALPGATLADKIEAYVLSCGFTREDVATFREIMLEK